MKYKLTEIFDFKELKELCESFTEINGTVVAILDLEGNVHVATGWQPACTEFHRINDSSKKQCNESDTILANQIKTGQNYNIYQCKNGLYDVAVPIMIENEHVGNIFTGQFFTEKPDIEYFRKQAIQFGFDHEKYLNAIEKVPIFSEEQIKRNINYLVKLTEILGKSGLRNSKTIEYAKQLEIEQTKLKKINEDFAALNKKYKTQNEDLRASNEKLVTTTEALKESLNDLHLAKLKIGKSEEKFRKAFLYNPDAISVNSIKTGKYISINKGFTDIFEYSPEEILGKTSMEIHIWNDINDRKKYIYQLETLTNVMNFETKFITKSGKIKDCLVSSVLIELDGEEYTINTTKDISHRKNLELEIINAKEKAEENAKQFRLLVENAPQAIFIQIDRKFAYLNNTCLKLYGAENHEQLLNKEIIQRIHPDYIEIVKSRINQLNENRLLVNSLEYKHLKLDNSVIDVEVTAVPIKFNNENGALVFVKDITERIRIENELKESKEQLNFAFEGSNDGLWDVNMQTDEVYINSRGCEILGYLPDEMEKLVKLWSDLVHPDDLLETNTKLQAHLENRTPVFEVEQRLQMKSGEWKWILSRGKVVSRDINGKPIRITGTHTDITDRIAFKEALISKNMELAASEEEIRAANEEILTTYDSLKETNAALEIAKEKAEENEARLIEAQSATKVGSWETNLLSLEVIWSEETYKIYELNSATFHASHPAILGFVHPEDKEKVDEAFIKSLNTTHYNSIEHRIITSSGKLKYVEERWKIQFDKQKLPIKAIGTCQDITERKKTEIALQRSETELKKAQQITHIGSWYLDVETNEVTWTEELYKMYGFDATLPPPPYTEHKKLFTKESWELLSASLARTTRQGVPYELELRTIKNNGKFGWMWVRGEAVVNVEGKIIGLWGAAQDITERKQIEEDLKTALEKIEESEQKFQIFMKYNPAYIYIKDETLKHIYSNQAVQDIITNPKDKLSSSSDIFEPNIVKMLEDADWEIINKEKENITLEYSSCINNNLTFFRDYKFAMTLPNGKHAVGGIAIDISETKLAEKKIFSLSKILENSLNEIYIFDIETLQFIYVNNGALRNIGYTFEELRKKTPADIKPEFDFDTLLNFLQPLKSNETDILILETIHQRKDGSLYNVYITLQISEFDNRKVFAAIVLDITEKKQNELKMIKALEKANESDRLKTNFLNNMSHEVRTPLNAIQGFSRLMSKPYQSPEKLKIFSDMISSSTKKLINIITDVIEISQIQANQTYVKYTDFDIISFINEIFHGFKKNEINKNIDFKLNQNILYNQFNISSDSDKLERIISHLIDNAIKFTMQGSVEITYSLTECEPVNLQLSIADTGIGISEDMQKIIFEPFRQVESGITRDFGGNGLGLPIARAYIKLLNGSISLNSQLNKGTTFIVTIPVNSPNQQEIQIPLIKLNIPVKTVLIAEDEYSNYQYLVELLEEYDFQILYAENGQKALEMCRSNSEIDLIFMDIKMPFMNGHTAAGLIKQFRPALPIIAQSAYALENERDKYSGIFDDYITKPINQNLLTEKLMKYIDKQGNKA